MQYLAAAILLLPLLASCSDPARKANPPGVPADWTPLDSEGRFTCYIPRDMHAMPVSGTDSFVGQYVGPGIELNFDYGWYSSDLKEQAQVPNVTIVEKVIGGQRGRVLTYNQPDNPSKLPFVAAVHFPTTGNAENKLTIVINTQSEPIRQTALKIIDSISFPPSPATKP